MKQLRAALLITLLVGLAIAGVQIYAKRNHEQEIARLEAARVEKEKAEARTRVDQFIKEALILDSATDQGVSYSEFSTQLARVRAMFELAYPGENNGSDAIHFRKAINGWLLIAEIWRLTNSRDLSRLYIGEAYDQKLLSAFKDVLGEYPPTATHDEGSDIYYVPGKKLVRIGMTIASAEFRIGKDSSKSAQ